MQTVVTECAHRVQSLLGSLDDGGFVDTSAHFVNKSKRRRPSQPLMFRGGMFRLQKLFSSLVFAVSRTRLEDESHHRTVVRGLDKVAAVMARNTFMGVESFEQGAQHAA